MEGLLHLFQFGLFQRYSLQPLTSHEDDMIDGAHLFKQLFQVRLDLLTAEVVGVTEDATFGKRVVGEDGLDAFVDFCFAG